VGGMSAARHGQQEAAACTVMALRSTALNNSGASRSRRRARYDWELPPFIKFTLSTCLPSIFLLPPCGGIGPCSFALSAAALSFRSLMIRSMSAENDTRGSQIALESHPLPYGRKQTHDVAPCCVIGT